MIKIGASIAGDTPYPLRWLKVKAPPCREEWNPFCARRVRARRFTRLPTATEGDHPTMPTLRRGAAPLLGAVILAFSLPACVSPPVAPAGPGPLREEAAP